MDFIQFTAGKDDARRADRIVRLLLSEQHLSVIYSAFRKGFIRVNNKHTRPNAAIHQGDIISIAAFLLPHRTLQQCSKIDCTQSVFPYDVILKNDDMLVINKPYDVEVQNELAKAVKRYYSSTKNSSLAFTPAPLHRLDKKTTGILFFSWSIHGAQWFSRTLAERKIKKCYIALVQGTLTQRYEWNNFIKKNAAGAPFHTVSVYDEECECALPAHTMVTPLCTGSSGISLVRFTITTGRTHQIRAQSAYHGYPLLGDTAYGANSIHEEQDMFLHAYEIELPENTLGLPEIIRAPLPQSFKKMNDKILKNWQETFILC